MPFDELISSLNSDRETGLSAARAQEGLSHHGNNKLEGEGGIKWYGLLLKQATNAMILVGSHQLWSTILLTSI
jgi:hypothetical protein